jgi:hypothetical protein
MDFMNELSLKIQPKTGFLLGIFSLRKVAHMHSRKSGEIYVKRREETLPDFS